MPRTWGQALALGALGSVGVGAAFAVWRIKARNNALEAERAVGDQQAREAASRVDMLGMTQLHYAAHGGNLAAARSLLGIAPEAATIPDKRGQLAFFLAAAAGHVELMRLLVNAQPATLTATNRYRQSALHVAAQHGKVLAVRWLLAMAPQLSAVRDDSGMLAVHEAADTARSPQQFQVIRLLLDSDPASAAQADDGRRTPLEIMLSGSQAARAASELGVRDPAATLALLRAARQPLAVVPALLDRIAASLPLCAIEWASLPPRLLAAALPLAQAHSPSQAGLLLVAHLPHADRGRLQTLALCMARVQRDMGTPLPAPDVHGILAQACQMLLAG